MNLNHHSKDFKRRLSQLAQDKNISTAKDLVPVEKQMTKEQLQHLHNCIHFTQTVMKDEARKRWDK